MQISSPHVQSEKDLYHHLFTHPHQPIDIQLVINALSFERNIQAIIFLLRHIISHRYNESLWASISPIKQQSLDQIATLIGLNMGSRRVNDGSIFLYKAIIDKDPFFIDLFYIIRTNSITTVEHFDRLLLKSPVYQYLLQHDYNRFPTPLQRGYNIDTYSQSYNPIDDQINNSYQYTPNPTLCSNNFLPSQHSQQTHPFFSQSSTSVSPQTNSSSTSTSHSSTATPYTLRSAIFSTTPVNITTHDYLSTIVTYLRSTQSHRNTLYAISIKQILKSPTDSLSLWLFPSTIPSCSPTYLLYDPLSPYSSIQEHSTAHLNQIHTCHQHPTPTTSESLINIHSDPNMDTIQSNYTNFHKFQHIHALNREKVHNYTNLNILNQIIYLQSAPFLSDPLPFDDNQHTQQRSDFELTNVHEVQTIEQQEHNFSTLLRDNTLDGCVGTSLISSSMKEEPISSLYRVTDSTNEEQLAIEQGLIEGEDAIIDQLTSLHKPLKPQSKDPAMERILLLKSPPHFSKGIGDSHEVNQKVQKISENGLKLHNHSRFCETYQGFLLPLYEIIEQTFDFELLELLLTWAKKIWHVEQNYYSLFLLGLVGYTDIVKYCKDFGIYHTNLQPVPEPHPSPKREIHNQKNSPAKFTPYPSTVLPVFSNATQHTMPPPHFFSPIIPRLPRSSLNLQSLYQFIIPYYMSSDVIMALSSPLCGHIFHKDNIVERFFYSTLIRTIQSITTSSTLRLHNPPTIDIHQITTNDSKRATFFDLFPHLPKKEHIKVLQLLSPHLVPKSNVINFNKPLSIQTQSPTLSKSEHQQPFTTASQSFSNPFHSPLNPNYHGQSAEYIRFHDQSLQLDNEIENKLNSLHKEYESINTDPNYLFNPSLLFKSIKSSHRHEKHISNGIQDNIDADKDQLFSLPLPSAPPVSQNDCVACSSKITSSYNQPQPQIKITHDSTFNFLSKDQSTTHIGLVSPSLAPQILQPPSHQHQSAQPLLIHDINTLIDVIEHNEYISSPPIPSASPSTSASSPNLNQFHYFQFMNSITQQDWLHTNPFLSNLHLTNFPLMLYSKLLQKRQLLLAVSQSSIHHATSRDQQQTTIYIHPAHYYLSQYSTLYGHLITQLQLEIVQLEKCMDMIFIHVPVGAWYSQQFQYIVDLIYLCATQSKDQVMIDYLNLRGISNKCVQLFSFSFEEMSFFDNPKAIREIFNQPRSMQFESQHEEEEDDEVSTPNALFKSQQNPNTRREDKKMKLLSLLSKNPVHRKVELLTINDLVDDICTEDEITYSSLLCFLRHDLFSICNYFLDIIYNVSNVRFDDVMLPKHNRNIFSSLILTCPSNRALQYLLSVNSIIAANSEFGDKNNIWLNLLQCNTIHRDDQITNTMLLTMFLSFQQFYVQTLKTSSPEHYDIIRNYQRSLRTTAENGTNGLLKTVDELPEGTTDVEEIDKNGVFMLHSTASKPYDILFDLQIPISLPSSCLPLCLSTNQHHQHQSKSLVFFSIKPFNSLFSLLITSSLSAYTWNTLQIYSNTPISTTSTSKTTNQPILFPLLQDSTQLEFNYNEINLSHAANHLPSQKNMFNFLWSVTTQQLTPNSKSSSPLTGSQRIEQNSTLLFKPHLPLLTLIQYLGTIDDISTLNVHIFEHLFYLLTPRELQLMGLSAPIFADILVQFEFKYKKYINLLSNYYCQIDLPLLIQAQPSVHTSSTSNFIESTTSATNPASPPVQTTKLHPTSFSTPSFVPHFDPKLHLFEKNNQRITKGFNANSHYSSHYSSHMNNTTSTTQPSTSIQYTTVHLRFNFILQRFHDSMCKIRYNYIKILELLINSPAKYGLFSTRKFVEPSQQAYELVQQHKMELRQQQSNRKPTKKSSPAIEITHSEMEQSNQESIQNNPFIVTFMKFAYLVNFPQAWKYVIFNNSILRIQSGYNYSLEMKEMEQRTKNIWNNCNFFASPYFNRNKLLYLCRVNSPTNQLIMLSNDITPDTLSPPKPLQYQYLDNVFSKSTPLISPYQSTLWTQKSMKQLLSGVSVDEHYVPLHCSYTQLDEPLFDDGLISFYEYLQTYREYYIEYILIRQRTGAVFFNSSDLLNPDEQCRSILNPKPISLSSRPINNFPYQPGAQSSDNDEDDENSSRLPTAQEIKHNLYDFPIHPDEIYRLLHDSTLEETMLSLYFSEENLRSPKKMLALLSNPENVTALTELVMNPILSHNSSHLLDLYNTILSYLDFFLNQLRSNPSILMKNKRHLASQPRYVREATECYNTKQSSYQFHYDPNMSLYHPQYNPNCDRYSHLDEFKHVITHAAHEVMGRITLGEDDLDGQSDMQSFNNKSKPFLGGIKTNNKIKTKKVSPQQRPDYQDFTGFDSDEQEPQTLNQDEDIFDDSLHCNPDVPSFPPRVLQSYRGHPFLDQNSPTRDISIPPIDHSLLAELLEELNSCATLPFHRFDHRYFINSVLSLPLNPSLLDENELIGNVHNDHDDDNDDDDTPIAFKGLAPSLLDETDDMGQRFQKGSKKLQKMIDKMEYRGFIQHSTSCVKDTSLLLPLNLKNREYQRHQLIEKHLYLPHYIDTNGQFVRFYVTNSASQYQTPFDQRDHMSQLRLNPHETALISSSKSSISIFDIYSHEYGLSCPLSAILSDDSKVKKSQSDSTTSHLLDDDINLTNDADNTMLLPLYIHQGYIYGDQTSYLIYNNNFQFFNKAQETQEETCPHFNHETVIQKPENNIIQFFLITKQLNYLLEFFRFLLLLYPNIQATHLFTYLLNTIDNGDYFTYNLLLQMGIDKDRSNQCEELSMFVIGTQQFAPMVSYSSHLIFTSILNELLTSSKAVFIPTDVPFDVAQDSLQKQSQIEDIDDNSSINPRQLLRGKSTYQVHLSQSSYSQLQRILLHFFPATSDYIVSLQNTHRTYIDSAENQTDHIVPSTATMDEHLHDPHIINSPFYQVLMTLSTISPSYYCHLRLQRIKYVLFYQLPLIEMIQNTCNNTLIEYSILEQQLNKQRQAQRELFLDQILTSASSIHTLSTSHISATATASPSLSFQQHINPQNGIRQYHSTSMYDPEIQAIQYNRLSQVFKSDFEFAEIPRHDAIKPFKGIAVSILYRFYTLQKEIHQWLAKQLLYLKFEICDIYLNNRSVFMYLQDPKMYLNVAAQTNLNVENQTTFSSQTRPKEIKQKKKKSKFLFNSSDEEDPIEPAPSVFIANTDTNIQNDDENEILIVHPYLTSHHYGLCLANITNLTASAKINSIPRPLNYEVVKTSTDPDPQSSSHQSQSLGKNHQPSSARRIYEFLIKPVDLTITMVPYTRYPSIHLSPLIVLHNITTPAYVHDSSLLVTTLTYMYCLGDLATFYVPTATLNKERQELLEKHTDHISEIEHNYAQVYYLKNVQNNSDLKDLTEEEFNAIISGVLAYKIHIQPTPSNRRSLGALTATYQQQMMTSIQSRSGKHIDILQYSLLLEKVLSHLQSYYSRHVLLYFYQYYYIMYYIQCVSHIHGLKMYFSGQLFSFLGYTNRTSSTLVKTIMLNPKLTSQIITELSVPLSLPVLFAPLAQNAAAQQSQKTHSSSHTLTSQQDFGMEITSIPQWNNDIIHSQRNTLKVPFYSPIMSPDPYQHNVYYLPTFSSTDQIIQHLENHNQGRIFSHLPTHFTFHQGSETVSWFYKALLQSRLHFSHITTPFQQLYHQYLIKLLKISTPPPNSSMNIALSKLEPFYQDPAHLQFLRTLTQISMSSSIITLSVPLQFHHAPLLNPDPTPAELERYLEHRQMIKINKQTFISSSHLVDFVDHFQILEDKTHDSNSNDHHEWELSKREQFENDDTLLLKSLFKSSLSLESKPEKHKNNPSTQIIPSKRVEPLPSEYNKFSSLLLPPKMKNVPPYLANPLIISPTQTTITSPIILQYFVSHHYTGYLLHKNKSLYAHLTKHRTFEHDLIKQHQLIQECKIKINPISHKDNFGEDIGTLSALFQQPESLQLYIQQHQAFSLLTSKDRFGWTLLHHLVSEDHHFHGDYIERSSALIDSSQLETISHNETAVISRGIFINAQVPQLPPQLPSQIYRHNSTITTDRKAPPTPGNALGRPKQRAVLKTKPIQLLPPTPEIIFSRQTLLRTSKSTIPTFISQLYCSHDLESNKDAVFVNHHSSLYQFLFYTALCFKHGLISRDYINSFDITSPKAPSSGFGTQIQHTSQPLSYRKIDPNDWSYQYMPALIDIEDLQQE